MEKDIITKENIYFLIKDCFLNANYDFSGRWYVCDKPLKERQPHHLLKGRYFLREKEASTGLGHINLWYGETQSKLSLYNAALRMNIFPRMSDHYMVEATVRLKI